MAAIADMTGDNKGDYALLGWEVGYYRVYLVNGISGAIVKSVAIGTDAQLTPKALSVTDDVNGDGAKDIAVWFTKPDASSLLQVFSGKTAALLKTLGLPK
jgi:hypothetical protein